MRRLILAAALIAAALPAASVKVTYELDIPPGAKARQVANEMVAAIPPVVWATAALRQSIRDGETSQTVIQEQRTALMRSLQTATRDAVSTPVKVMRKSADLLPQNAWD